jgi:hypothetical protein
MVSLINYKRGRAMVSLTNYKRGRAMVPLTNYKRGRAINQFISIVSINSVN